MGLVGNEYDAAVRANNKYLMRNAFMDAGVPCPLYNMVDGEYIQDEECMKVINLMDYPLIVKPSDRSGLTVYS
jgi:biotin carboxylase